MRETPTIGASSAAVELRAPWKVNTAGPEPSAPPDGPGTKVPPKKLNVCTATVPPDHDRSPSTVPPWKLTVAPWPDTDTAVHGKPGMPKSSQPIIAPGRMLASSPVDREMPNGSAPV
jgi:hypothetical protein